MGFEGLSKLPLTDVVTPIPGREHYFEELDDQESENDTGISKGLKVSFTAEQQRFHLYVVHLASESGGHDQDQQRIAQASIVRRHYLQAARNGKHAIVAGDLNDRRGEPTLQRIRGLDDLWDDLIQTGNVDFFNKNTEDTRWTYQFEGVRGQIDHILVSRSVFDKWKIASVVPEQTNDLASGHRPFMSTLTRR